MNAIELKKGFVLKGKYEIESKTGEGGYGIAYKARKINDGGTVLIKQARNRKRKTSHSFEMESLILRSLKNIQIPELYEQFVVDRHMYLAMEFKNGRTFEELIFDEGHVYTEEQSIAILAKITAILASIHERGIVHRDLRIPNILLDGQDIHIIDFGLARNIGDKQKFSFFKKKKRYREISFISDFYALGHFLLFLLYSGYSAREEKEKPWEEELNIDSGTRLILRRMLQIDSPYERIDELQKDLNNQRN
ncbi:serine/threonine protein kinase [Bacillus sp. SJS]|uniref:serine/threonine protein kinase n=1 Tax=Bacillus sp. SJS TaxID=1423321 RepID=UPI0004DD15EC|nr:protein kinase [Bacillus sp. SJS]KZZ84273.1 hypothetical protein AS29_011985 [Bacillus sp. SJS]